MKLTDSIQALKPPKAKRPPRPKPPPRPPRRPPARSSDSGRSATPPPLPEPDAVEPEAVPNIAEMEALIKPATPGDGRHYNVIADLVMALNTEYQEYSRETLGHLLRAYNRAGTEVARRRVLIQFAAWSMEGARQIDQLFIQRRTHASRATAPGDPPQDGGRPPSS